MTEVETPRPPAVTQDAEGCWRDAKGRPCCGAKTRTGGRCAIAILGTGGRCRLHGGKSLRGVASPSFRHGRRSRYWTPPARRLFAEIVARAADPDLLNLARHIAAADLRAEQLLAAAASQQALVTTDVASAFGGLKGALRTRDPVKVQAAFERCEQTVEGSQQAAAAWRAALDVFALRGRLAEVEARRRHLSQTTLGVDEAWALVSTIIRLVRDHVPDPVARRAIAEGVQRMVGTLPRLGAGTAFAGAQDGTGEATAEA